MYICLRSRKCQGCEGSKASARNAKFSMGIRRLGQVVEFFGRKRVVTVHDLSEASNGD